jgi:hypothetical protein
MPAHARPASKQPFPQHLHHVSDPESVLIPSPLELSSGPATGTHVWDGHLRVPGYVTVGRHLQSNMPQAELHSDFCLSRACATQ